MTSIDKNNTEKVFDTSSSSVDFPTPNSSRPPSPYVSPLHPPPPPPPAHQQTLYFLAVIYPVTIIFGGLFSVLSPQGHMQNYFSQKHNVFNLLFVKVGWFWTTAAFIVHLLRIRGPTHSSTSTASTSTSSSSSSNSSTNNTTTKLQIKAAIRWGLATLFWVFITQWFFGPPLMDRTFSFTGGLCQPAADGTYTSNSNPNSAEEVFTSAACKLAGGNWAGGHDLSGHVFMLTHASMFLWAEIMPRLLDTSGVVQGPKGGNNVAGEWMGVHWFVWSVLGLWWWMLLMTSVYFHTWQEKVCPPPSFGKKVFSRSFVFLPNICYSFPFFKKILTRISSFS